ncbi:MAG: RodZ domain-containing protein, partial [Thiohalorhabdaceae bacterium]
EDSPGEDGNGEAAGEAVADPEDTREEPAQEPSGSGSTAEKPAADSAGDEGSGSERDPEQRRTDKEGTETESQTAATSRPEGTALTGPGLEAPRLPELPGRNDDDQQAQPGDLQTLRVHTWADSWIEVADDRGRTLLRRLVKEGRDVRLYGEAPFQVKVGNAAGVQLYFEGEPLTPLGDQGEVVSLNVDGESPTVAESEVAPPGESEPEPEMAGTESEETNATAE